MADVTANKVLTTTTRSGRSAYQIKNGDTIYAGELVGIEASSGYLTTWADGANDVFIGIVLGDALGVSPGGALTGDTSATPVPEARVDDSGVVLTHLTSVAGASAVTATGDLVYCPDGDIDELTTTIGSNVHPVGFVKRWRSATDVDVQLFTPTEMLAQANA